MRWLIREIALSRTYQRSSVAADVNDVDAPPQSYRLALEKPLSAEQMLASLRQALGGEEPLTMVASDKTWTQWQASFEKALANPAREPEVEHSPTSRLVLMHDPTNLQWLKPQGETHGPAAKLKTLRNWPLPYLAVLSRPPRRKRSRP
jgi:hypothetical protein